MHNLKMTYMLLTICLFLMLSNGAASEYHDSIDLLEIANASTLGVPIYEMFSYTTYLEVNEKEDITINYYLAGAGQVDYNKIRISIPPSICMNDTVVYQTIEANWSNPQMNEYEKHIYEAEGSQPGGVLPPIYFRMESNSFYNLGGRPWQSADDALLVTPLSSNDNSVITPISLNFTIADNAPKGNHEVLFIVFYKYNDVWYSTQESVTVHVKSIYEQTWVEFLGVIVGALTIASIILTGYSTISDKNKKSDEPRSENSKTNSQKIKN